MKHFLMFALTILLFSCNEKNTQEDDKLLLKATNRGTEIKLTRIHQFFQ